MIRTIFSLFIDWKKKIRIFTMRVSIFLRMFSSGYLMAQDTQCGGGRIVTGFIPTGAY